jgi:hypothetical protein
MRALTIRQALSLTGAAAALAICGLSGASCGGSSAGIIPFDGGSDSPSDGTMPHDGATDAKDAAKDRGSDSPTDSPTDVPMDVPTDTVSDVPLDSPTDHAEDHVDSGQVSCKTNSTACASPPGGECCANVCVPGNCCVDTDCTSGADIACQSNTCTACDAVTGGAYFVDPVNGSDGAETMGSNSAGGTTAGICAFKTIGHAIKVIGTTAATGTTITVLSNDSNAINGEVFPLVVPANTTVLGATASVTITVSGSTTTKTDGGTVVVTPHDGFHLVSPASGLTTLILDGSIAAASARGVVVDTGSTNTTTLANLTIDGFPDAGIHVQNTGVLTVNPGTVSTANLFGIRVTGSASATVTGSSTAQTAFNANQVGILVDTSGSISITGTPGTGGDGTVVANSNTGGATAQDGVIFNPTPSNAGTLPPASLINGLVVWNSGNNGIHIFGGSNVGVKNSYILNNGVSGIRVDNNSGACTGALCTNNNYTDVNLGMSGTGNWGLNTLQDPTNPNKVVGICFAPTVPLSFVTAVSLNAAGNIFGADNCSMTAAALTQQNDCTTKTNDDLGLPSTTNISITTTMCTY